MDLIFSQKIGSNSRFRSLAALRRHVGPSQRAAEFIFFEVLVRPKGAAKSWISPHEVLDRTRTQQPRQSSRAGAVIDREAVDRVSRLYQQTARSALRDCANPQVTLLHWVSVESSAGSQVSGRATPQESLSRIGTQQPARYCSVLKS